LKSSNQLFQAPCIRFRSIGVVCSVLLIFLITQNGYGQSAPWPYTFPIRPGQQAFLAGTMGELRATHFHAGLDIRTGNMTGSAVITASKGYVARAWISTFGYGNVLFVNHPNGQTTVYAHLDKFKGRLGDFVRDQQYQRKTFEIDLTFTPGQFPVSDGDTIAYSGNSGGSGGPHLHFEIRDSSNHALNPLCFDFREIKDPYPPVVQKIALKTLDLKSRINNRYGRFEFYTYKAGNSYIVQGPISAQGRIGVEILAYDKMDRSGFRCGINYIEMYADGQRKYSQTIERIDFGETHDIISLMDYPTLKSTGSHFNKLFIDDGSRLSYHQAVENGVISVRDKDVASRIVLHDSYGNVSEVNFTLKSAPIIRECQTLGLLSKPWTYSISENALQLSVRQCQSPFNVVLYRGKESMSIEPAYKNSNQSVYLVDLKESLPDSIATCQGVVRFNLADAIPSQTGYKYYGDWVDLKFEKDALYDTLYLNLSTSRIGTREVFSIGDNRFPLRHQVSVVLKPETSYGPAFSAYRVNGTYTFLGGEWINGRIHFNTQELGDFVLLKDTISPMIHRISLNSSTARFRIQDNLSGIAYFEARIAGEWLLMNYDYKTGILQSERLDNSKPLRGDFQLKVKDQAGNEKLFNQNIP
jgi:Peptidase family M23